MSALGKVVEQAGWVSGPLIVVSLLMWTMVMLRLQQLWGGVGDLRALVKAALGGSTSDVAGSGHVQRFVGEGAPLALRTPPALDRLTALADQCFEQLTSGRAMLRALVAAAPLLGLLGTVDGMIEMFGALHGSAAAQLGESTVAGGISQALISTQLGLVIGIPGLLAAQLTERLETRRRAEIQAARALLAGEGLEIRGGASLEGGHA
jgi:biopolymer transport protein ExbB